LTILVCIEPELLRNESKRCFRLMPGHVSFL
jgi:hypothetical protein